MGVNVADICDWLNEYAKRNNSTVDNYGTNDAFDGNISEENLMHEIKRKNKTKIVIRWYNYNQLQIDLNDETPTVVLGISFLTTSEARKKIV